MNEKKSCACGMLSDEALSEALALSEKASPEILEHLAACPGCRGELERTNAALARVTDLAARSAPPLRKRIKLPPDRAPAPARGRDFRLSFALAAMLLIAAAGLFGRSVSPLMFPARTSVESVSSAPLFFEDREAYADNALPPDYMDMAGESSAPDEESFDDPAHTEDFISFTAPT